MSNSGIHVNINLRLYFIHLNRLINNYVFPGFEGTSRYVETLGLIVGTYAGYCAFFPIWDVSKHSIYYTVMYSAILYYLSQTLSLNVAIIYDRPSLAIQLGPQLLSNGVTLGASCAFMWEVINCFYVVQSVINIYSCITPSDTMSFYFASIKCLECVCKIYLFIGSLTVSHLISRLSLDG